MQLLFDIGNTRLKWGLADEGGIIASGALVLPDLSMSGLDQQILATKDLEAKGSGGRDVGGGSISPEQIDQVSISNVSGHGKVAVLNEWLAARFTVVPLLVTVNESVYGITNTYRDTGQLGIDRWLAVIGARSLLPEGDLIVVDAGTAVTIDWLSLDNVFEGGVILPGQELMNDSLVGRTAGIESEYLSDIPLIGKTTSECVSAGVAYGLAGAVDRIVADMQQHIARPLRVLLTGGGAEALAKNMAIKAGQEPQLVLLGLLSIASSTSNDRCES